MDASSDVVAAWMHPPVKVVHADTRLDNLRGLALREGFQHVVVEEDRQMVGVISDREVMRDLSPRADSKFATASDRATLEKPAHQIMGRLPVTISPDGKMRDAAALMLSHKTHCLPVVDGTRCVGILTTSAVLRWTLAVASGQTAEIALGRSA